MQDKFGIENFDIIPDTYILPDEFADFYDHFHSLKSKLRDGEQNMWIVKPAASSQGRGIYIIDDISEAPIKENCVISRYINNPLLINNIKFDIRIYVLVTSIDPWRIYLYKEGLARFASEAYCSTGNKSNRFSHLTNYSINKKHEKFVQNSNVETDDIGNKWSISALNKYLESIGVDLNLLWSRIYDIIIKSFL
jgi:tubulin polyglutamylase TTLL5